MPSRGRSWVGVLLGCLGLLVSLPGIARADDAPCGAGTLAWIEAASRATAVSIAPVACHPGLARLRLALPGAPAIDVEIAEPPGPAFRHAGRLRVSPIVEIADYRMLPAPQREGVERLVVWLEANADRVVLAAAEVHPKLAGAAWGIRWAGGWLAAAALAVGGAGAWLWRRRPSAPRIGPDAAVTAALGVAALALRLALGVWGPHHINGQGPLWVLGAAVDPGQLGAYGPGYAELFGWVTRLAPSAPDHAIFAANAVISALAAPLCFALGRGGGLDRPRAAVAAALVALDPIAIRSGATESYFAPAIALSLGASLAMVIALRAWIGSARVAAGLLTASAALLAAQAARVHPVAWIPIALSPLIVLAASAEAEAQRTWRVRAAGALILGSSVAAGVVLVSGGWILAVLAETRRYQQGVAAGLDARGAILLLVLLVPWALVARPRALAFAGAAHLLADLALRKTYGQSAVWMASFDRLFLAVPLLGLAAALPARLAARAGAQLAAAGAVAAALLVWGRPHLAWRTTEQLEYRFLRQQLSALPAGCHVTSVLRAERRVVYVPEYVVRRSAPGARAWSDASEDSGFFSALPAASGCLVYIHTSLCSSAEGRAACETAERALPLRTSARATLPAIPSYDDLPYDTAAVDVVVYTVTP